ncbi:deoxyguanosinetriphosphate triphosphohydrolase [Planctomycetota bacterium]
MIRREDIEAREQRELAPFAVRSSESRGREHSEQEHAYRTSFQRDRDRVVHSAAFRRLEYKTQVFVNHEGDYYRTRLTHTMEMAQIGRSIGRVLQLNEDLIEAIALAHDLGHTPFGHSGEEALQNLMKGHGGFEHNRQSLRIVEKLERRYPNFRGLNLTFEVRESLEKHSTAYDNSTRPDREWDESSVLESQVVDVSDSIAYDTHDLDDGLTAGILDETSLMGLDLWREADSAARSSCVGGNDRIRMYQTIRALINILVTDLVHNASARVAELGLSSADDARKAGAEAVCFSSDMKKKKDDLESFLYQHMYKHYRVVRMARKARRFVKEMFAEYAQNTDQLPPEYQEWAEAEGIERSVCDYIAGMTDRFAQDEYKRLFHPFERV